MRKEFYKTLINLIVIVSLLLALCVCVDYAANATNDTIISNDTDIVIPENVIFINGSYVDLDNSSGIAKTDGKIYTDKNVKVKKQEKIPTITITAKPSVRSSYAYKWYTTTWVDYCPYCHRYNVLYNAHKWPARFEQELTCKRCSADFCGVTGKEKYSWSHVYLTKA